MALFFDGFEQFDRAESPAAEMRLADYQTLGAVAIGTGRIGSSRALLLTNAYVSKSWQWTDNLFAVGAAMKFAARGQMISLGGGLDLWMDSISGRAKIGEELGLAGPVKDRWYYFEMELNRSAETATLYINGKEDLVVSLSEEILASPVLTITLNPFNLSGGDNGLRTVDDFYMNNGGRMQPIQVTTRFPSSDTGPNEWSPTAGPGVPHYTMVAPLPTDKLDRYLIANISGAQENFVSSASLPDDNPIVGIGMISLVRKTTVESLTLTTRFNGREVLEADIPLSWRYRFSQFALAGDTAASVEAANFGVTLNRN